MHVRERSPHRCSCHSNQVEMRTSVELRGVALDCCRDMALNCYRDAVLDCHGDTALYCRGDATLNAVKARPLIAVETRLSMLLRRGPR